MLADFYIIRLSNAMKIALQKKSSKGSSKGYRSSDACKKRRQRSFCQYSYNLDFDFQNLRPDHVILVSNFCTQITIPKLWNSKLEIPKLQNSKAKFGPSKLLYKIRPPK